MSHKLRNRIKNWTAVCITVGAMALTGPAILTNMGCASANKTAYKMYAGGQITVQEALVFWNTWLGQNPSTSVDTQKKVKTAFNDWKASMLVVGDAGQAWATALRAASQDPSVNPAIVNAALATFENAVNNANQYQADFVNLVQTVTGKQIIR